MRNKNFRREQERLHYKKRVDISVALKRYVKRTNEKGEEVLVPDFHGKLGIHMIDHRPEHCYGVGPAGKERNEEYERMVFQKRWIHQLKRNSIPKSWEEWGSASAGFKRISRRTFRKRIKCVDFNVPGKRWLDRASVSHGMPKSDIDI